MKKTLAIGMASLFGLAAIGTVSASDLYVKTGDAIKVYTVYTEKDQSDTYSSNYLDGVRKRNRIGVTTKVVPNYVFEHYNGGYYLPFYESERIGQGSNESERPVYSKYDGVEYYNKKRLAREIPEEEIEDRSIYGVNYVGGQTVTNDTCDCDCE